MNGKPTKFIDTNVLLYVLSTDMEKKRTAIGLCEENAIISFNVLNEFVNVCRKKFLRPFDAIRGDIRFFLGTLTLVFPGYDTFERALEIGKATGYSHFDCLIIAAALEADCSVFYSEDLQHGRIIEEKMKVINPFIG